MKNLFGQAIHQEELLISIPRLSQFLSHGVPFCLQGGTMLVTGTINTAITFKL